MTLVSSSQRSPIERHKPGTVLSRKERQGQTMLAENSLKTPFFAAPAPIQAKCTDCKHEEKTIQTKSEPTQTALIQAKCADCEHDDIHRSEHLDELHRREQDQHPAVQKMANTSAASAPSGDFAGGLTVGRPNDRFEREADQMGEQVQRMPVSGFSAMVFSTTSAYGLNRNPHHHQEDNEADIQPKRLPVAPALQRKADGAMHTSGQFTSQVKTSAGGGTSLAAPVQQGMESAFQADFSRVRIHTDTQAAQLSQDIGAKAFTYGNDIFFNQNQYDPGSSEGRFLLAHELTHTVQQGAAVKRAVQPSASAPVIQASLFDDALAWMATHFDPDVIPGYSLLSVIIQYDFIRRRRVERNAENLVKGLLELVPVFGMLLYNLLHEHNILNQAFQWVTSQLSQLDLSQDRIKRTFQEAWDGVSLHASDVLDVGEAINRNLEAIKRPFVRLTNDVVTFVGRLKDKLLSMLKEALVAVLRGLAIDKMPAYKLFTKVIGHDPITDETINAPLEDILADFLDLLGKQQEREEMQKRGTIKKTADWLRAKLGQFMNLLGLFRALVTHLWAAFSFESLRDPMGVLNGLITEGAGLVKKVWDFASDVASTVLKFIKDALLGLLRDHAHEIRGYKLLTVILEKDPVTDTPVKRDAESLIGGFIELVAGPETFAEIQQSGAIREMLDWLNAQIEKFQITWEGIKKLFTDIWNSLHIGDLINPIGAFIRVVAKFQKPIEQLIGFVVAVVKQVIYVILKLMDFPFDLVNQIIARAMEAYEDIKRDPIAFLKNLLRAVQQGFKQFFDNIGKHLLGGLVGWLTSELKRANVQPPKDFSFRSIVTFVLDVLGISMEKIWQKLAEHPKIGQAKVDKIRRTIDKLTGVWEFIKDVTKDGPGGIWKHIQEKLTNLWDTVLDQVKSWILGQIIDKMVTKLLSMLDPTGIMTVINGCIAFYKAVQSFIERLTEILQVVNSFVVGVAEIAKGVVTKGADFLERAMANALPTIIGFLANQVGLGGLGHKIGEMIQSVRDLVDKGLTWLVNKAVTLGESALNALGLGGKGEEAAPSPIGDFSFVKPVSMSGQGHSLTFTFNKNEAELIIASDPAKFHVAVSDAIKEVEKSKRPTKESDLQKLYKVQKEWGEIKSDIKNNKEKIIKGTKKDPASELDAVRQYAMTRVAEIANELQVFASTAGIKALDDFYKAPPTERYIPGFPNQKEVGNFIRKKIYEGIHSWETTRSAVENQERPAVLKKISDAISKAKNKQDRTDWDTLMNEGLLIEKNASFTSYNPATIQYDVDHIEPLTKRWNNQGSNSDDAQRFNELTQRNNLRYITHEANVAKGSGGILYKPYVGPTFVSRLADGGIKGAKKINNQPFLDATGKPIP